MIACRGIYYRFCRINSYLERFQKLEQEVNRREEEVLIKKAKVNHYVYRFNVLKNYQHSIIKINCIKYCLF